jgi:hypothetical protein
MLETLCFLLGIHMAMLLVSACYRIIDLWYRLSEYVLGILARIFIIGGVSGLCYWGFEGDLRTAFVAGQIFFVSFHIMIYWVGRTILALLYRK